MSEESVDSLLAWRTISRLDWGERELGTPTSSDLLNPVRLASAKLYTHSREGTVAEILIKDSDAILDDDVMFRLS